MGDASTVPSSVICCRRIAPTLVAVIPVGSLDALERPASQPNRVQSWLEAMELCDCAGAAALSCGARDDGAAPHAASAGQDTRETNVTRRFIGARSRCDPGVCCRLHSPVRRGRAYSNVLRRECPAEEYSAAPWFGSL